MTSSGTQPDIPTREVACRDSARPLPPYRVLRKPGECGMGVVYEAEEFEAGPPCRPEIFAPGDGAGIAGAGTASNSADANEDPDLAACPATLPPR